MLVITRKAGERIRIGADVWVEIIAVEHGGRRVKLGIDAPKNVVVDREEISMRRELENGNSNSK